MRKLSDYIGKHEKGIAALTAGMVFIMLFIMYQYTEFFADDLVYMNQWESSHKLSSFADIIYFQKMHYLTWGGRTTAHTILQLLFLAPKPAAAFLNTLCYSALAYMICLCAFSEKPSLKYCCLALGLLYYINPYFEETMHWYTGMANYAWMSLLFLIASYPYFFLLKYPDKKPGTVFWLLLPLSVLGGWTNENMGPSMVLFMMANVLLMLKEKRKVSLYYYISILFSSIGCAFLLLAPGNFIRTGEFSLGLMAAAYRGHGQINAWFDWLFIPLILCIILCYISGRVREHTNEEKRMIYLVSFWFAVSVLAMLASPSYPQRATFGSFVLLLILILFFVRRISDSDIRSQTLISCLCLVIAFGFAMVLLSIDLLAIVRAAGVYIPH